MVLAADVKFLKLALGAIVSFSRLIIFGIARQPQSRSVVQRITNDLLHLSFRRKAAVTSVIDSRTTVMKMMSEVLYIALRLLIASLVLVHLVPLIECTCLSLVRECGESTPCHSCV